MSEYYKSQCLNIKRDFDAEFFVFETKKIDEVKSSSFGIIFENYFQVFYLNNNLIQAYRGEKSLSLGKKEIFLELFQKKIL